jgi:dTDP-4-dehydrorhamnose reductase
MLGHKLWQVLSERFETHVTAREPYASYAALGIFDPARWHAGVDVMQTEQVRQVVERLRPSVIINCIGIIKQRKAATDPLCAIRINSLWPHELYGIAQAANAYLIHMSTDCVFSGNRGGYTEQDLPDPVDLYGRSKLLGEIDAPGCLTLRTSIIGHELCSRYGLVEWFLSQDGGRVRGFAHAIYTGVPTRILALMIADLLTRESPLCGLYQLASAPISKYDLLVLLRDAYQVAIEIERDETFRCDRSLKPDRLYEATGLRPPSWPDMVAAMAADSAIYASGRR